MDTSTINLERSKDGYWVDSDTGEVLGHEELVTAEEVIAALAGNTVNPSFEVTDEASADWVLGKISEADGNIAGLKARKAAIIANFDTQIKEQERRKSWLLVRFMADLERFAKSALENAKSRTLTLAYGKLSFRKMPGRIEARDEAQAIEWARVHAPLAVKTVESLLMMPLKGMESSLPGDIFEVHGPADKFSVDTGVK